ncbi:MAG TPA: hypothetical protein VFA78_07000 [Chloroflexota bacterium]|nr:hypothetical protein [Chloroflexota bacterium]
MHRVIAGAALTILLLGALFVPPGSTSARSGAARASIRILSPKGHVTVPVNGKIHLKLAVTGIKLNASAMGRKAVAGEGHYHFYVDCIPPAAYKQPHNFGNCWEGAAASLNPTFDLASVPVQVPPGNHTLLVALAQNNHVLYQASPAILFFTVVKPAPAKPMSVQILSPKDPVTVSQNGKIHLKLAIKGLKLNMAAMGRKPVAGEGHYHFYVDCIPSAAYSKPHNFGSCWEGAAAGLNPTFDLASVPVKIPPGTHILLVALAQNNHVLYRANAATLVFTVQ